MVLLVVRIIYFFLVKNIKNLWGRVLVSSLLFLVGYLLNGKSVLPFKIIPAMTCVFFQLSCELFKRFIDNLGFEDSKILTGGTTALISLIGLLITFLLSTLEQPNLNVISNSFPNNIVVTLICAEIGSISICFLSIFIQTVCYMQGILSYYGSISLLIMGVHSEIRVIVLSVTKILGCTQQLRSVIVFFITLLLVIPIHYCFSKYIPILSGCYNYRTDFYSFKHHK